MIAMRALVVGLLLVMPTPAAAHIDAHDVRTAWMSMGESQGFGERGIFDARDVRFGPRRAVPQRPCQPGDRPETDLQGRVPPSDLASGRAAQGYSCNLEVVGYFHGPGGSTLDSLDDCAYYGMGAYAGGSQVLDVSDGRFPLPTATMATPAMTNAWESLRVNAKRELLVADSPSSPYLDIYDVSGDCRQPRLLSSTDMSPAIGHEGWFSPDGMTYYMSTTGQDGAPTVFPVGIRDPSHPKLLAPWTFESQTHGGSTTEDGTRSYICQQQTPPKDKLLVVDTSEVAAGTPSPKPRLLTDVPLEDNQWCQAAYRVTYDGHPFLIQYGERSGAAYCERVADNWATFGYPRIYDLADERNPKLVSTALLESALPEHCEEVTGEGAVNGLGYSVHHCSPDRLYDPTILACSYFFAGMRVLDIRDPHHPVEIGYYNPGVSAVVGTAARPVVRSERGEIWFVHEGGFYVMRFEDGIWPFEGSARCPEFDDYFFAHYNPGSRCPTANFNGIGKPAPGGTTVPAASRGRCGGRNASISTGSSAGALLRGTPGDDVIAGGPGDDLIIARGGDDLICARAGDDRVRAGNGADRVLARAGNDRIRAGAGADVIRSGAGRDRAGGGAGDDRIHGGAGADRLGGGRGADRLYGGRGRDRCNGGPGGPDSTAGCERARP